MTKQSELDITALVQPEVAAKIKALVAARKRRRGIKTAGAGINTSPVSMTSTR